MAGILILTSFLALLAAIGIERWRTIACAIKQSRTYESRALTALYYGRPDEACDAASLFPKSPVASVLTAVLYDAKLQSSTANPLRCALKRAVIAQTGSLRKKLWVLAAIGWSSPIVGLLFALGPASRDSVDPPFVMCFGLAIAVPAIWLHKGLSSAVDRIVCETNEVSLSLIEQIEEHLRLTFDNRRAFRHHAAP